MVSIEHPILFSLLIMLILPVVIFLSYKQWRNYSLKALGSERNLRSLLTNYSFQPYKRTFFLLMAALVCIIIASVNIRRSDKASSDWVKGLDILVALDVSKSMLANDEKPSRLEKSKIFVKNVLSKLSNDQVGLIIFAGKAYIQAPLTNDYNMVNMLLENAHPSQVPHMGTDISDPISWSQELFDPEQMKYKVLLLISDGEDHNDNAIAMAEKAREQGIAIITVGIGSKDGAPLINADNHQPVTDEKGEVVISRLNEELLKEIARITDGDYVYLKNINQAADKVVSAINGMEKKDMQIRQFNNYKSYFTIFALAALVLLVLDHVKGLRRKKKGVKSASAVALLLIMFSAMSVSSSAQGSKNIPVADTTNSLIHLYKGNRHYTEGRWDEAIQEYKQSIEKNKSNYLAQFNAGNTYYRKNDFESARAHYQDVIKTAVSDEQRRSYAYYNAGNAYMKDEKYAEAVKEYIEGLKMNPGDQEMKYNLSYALKKLKEKENDQDQNQDDQKKDEQDNEQPNEQNGQNDDQQQQPRDQNEEQKTRPQEKLNKEQLEANLRSVSDNEKDIQKNRNRERGQFVRPEKDW